MRQYERTVEEVLRKNPKHGKEYGIKRPESSTIVAAIAILFTLSMIIAELM